MNDGELSAPLFQVWDTRQLANETALDYRELAGKSFAMTGPGETAEAGHLPVRGDLAHIRLAGRYFVPHYAVPMPYITGPAGAQLLKAGRADSDVIESLSAGASFNVLDIAGSWAWGQVGDDGFVGYIALHELAGAPA